VKLEQQIEEELKRIGRISTMSTVDGLVYFSRLKYMMKQYQEQNKGQLYVPPFCTDCKSKYATNQKGWGSAL
jgi:hypothetical protein